MSILKEHHLHCMAWEPRYTFFAYQLDSVLVGLQTAVEEVHRGAEAIAENYRHSALESREQYDAMYKRSVEDPEGFWGDIAKEFYWKKQLGPSKMVPSWLHGNGHAFHELTSMSCAQQSDASRLHSCAASTHEIRSSTMPCCSHCTPTNV